MKLIHLKYLILLFTGALCIPAYGASSLSFSGNSLKVIDVVPEKNTGLDHIYVAYDLKGVTVSYQASTSSPVKWYRYSALGGGYAEEIEGVTQSGLQYTLNTVEGDMGYIVEEGTNRSYFWIVDYQPHRLWLKGLAASPEQECGITRLTANGEGEPIHYYSINGRRFTLSQDIEINYYTMEWSEDDMRFNQVPATYTLESFSENIYITPPALSDTRFTISGDRFLREWKWEQSAESDYIPAHSLEVHTWAEQLPESTEEGYLSNVITGGTDGLGGSAPADITFYAEGTDAMIHYEWQMASDPDFENLLYRFNDRTLNYIFREEGIRYLRYIGSNSDGSCEAIGETYEVSIGSSMLKCPNAFSPGATEGVNDEWKVSYRSIIDFDCRIFNRHGKELFHFTDPSQGWDGKVRGKVVSPGVYFYVISATGADGQKYKLSGDINIINYRFNGTTGGGSGDESEAQPAE